MRYWGFILGLCVFFGACEPDSFSQNNSETRLLDMAKDTIIPEPDEAIKSETVSENFDDPEISNGSSHIYRGEIDKRYPIEMQLVTDSKNVWGSYKYIKTGKRLPLRGSVNSNKDLSLEVYDAGGETLETFKGNLVTEDTAFNGKWSKIDAGAKEYNFEVAEAKPSFNDIKLDSLTGTYEYRMGEVGYTLVAEYLKKGQIKFQLFIGNKSCFGEAAGIAFLEDDITANFYGADNCMLNFKLKPETINVEETICYYYHGFRCSFGGNYQKISEEPEWIEDIL